LKKSLFKIWAVLNLTPDSFYPESRVTHKDFVNRCVECLSQGADVLDIGAESTRPFSQALGFREEWDRLEAPLTDLRLEIGQSEFSKRVSIDTYKAETAQKVLELGVGFINDVSGGKSSELLKLTAQYDAGIVLMHSRGEPADMQVNPQYTDVGIEILEFLRMQSEKAIHCGVAKNKIIWDVGIGFGKLLEHNLQLLKNTDIFRSDGFPLMVGISRKSFIDKLLNIPSAEQRRDPTIIINTYLALHQVDILRVHDIKDADLIRKIIQHLI